MYSQEIAHIHNKQEQKTKIASYHKDTKPLTETF